MAVPKTMLQGEENQQRDYSKAISCNNIFKGLSTPSTELIHNMKKTYTHVHI